MNVTIKLEIVSGLKPENNSKDKIRNNRIISRKFFEGLKENCSMIPISTMVF